MKKSSLVAASVASAAASATALSSKTQSPRPQDDIPAKKTVKSAVTWKSSAPSSTAAPPSSEKFAPRFDGLRFIETLVTAHR